MKFLALILFITLSLQLSAGEAKWSKEEKALIKKLSSQESLYQSQKKDISERSKLSIHYVLQAFSELDQKQLAQDLKNLPFHRFNTFEEREMMMSEARKFDQGPSGEKE